MLPARVVTVFMFLLFSLGNLMPGKHLLLETESEDSEAAEPQGEGEVVKRSELIGRVLIIYTLFIETIFRCGC